MALTRITKGVIKPNENYDTHNIHSTGIVTATRFDGPFTNLNVSGVTTFTGDANFGGNVSIAGTLTYEDVTNIDSVGIITAQKDIHVGAGLSVVGVSTLGTSGSVFLQHNGTTRLQTNSSGVLINGAANIFNNGSNICVGGLGINASIFHNGDENTAMDFHPVNDRVRFRTGGGERLAITNTGIHFNVTGISTFEGNIDANGDLDVDGHTNLDNVSIAGVTTMSGNLTISNTAPVIKLVDTDSNSDFSIYGSQGVFNIYDETNTASRLTIASDGTITALQGLVCSSDLTIPDSIIHSGDTNTKIRFPDADTFSVETASNERLRITSTGNVIVAHNGGGIGIRTDNPTTTFHVRGAGVFTSQTGGTITNGLFLDPGDTGAGNRPDIMLKGAGSAALNNLAMQVYYNNGSDKAFHLRYDGGTYHLGNIGIGVENPFTFDTTADDLVISRSYDAGITISVGNAGTTNTASILFAEGTGGTQDKARGAIKYKHGDDYLAFHTNYNEQLRLDANGRLKVGDNTRPASDANEGAQLRVAGAPLTRNQYYSPYGQYFGSIGYTDNSNTKVWLAVDSGYAQSSAVSAGIFLSAFHQDAGGSNCGYTIKNYKSDNSLTFNRVKTAASTGNPAIEEERVRITAAGNVGINQNNPTVKLQVTDTSAVHIRAEATANDGDALIQAKGKDSSGNDRMIQMRTDAGADQYRIISSDTSYSLALCTGNAPRVLIAGNSAATSIGGANTFNAMLTTQGDVSGGLLMLKATENTNRFFVSGNNTSGCEVNLYDEAGGQKGILGVSGTEFFIKAPNTNAPLVFHTNNGSSIVERLRIASNGNVAINGDTNNVPRHLWLYNASNDPYFRIQRGSTGSVVMGGIEIASSNGNGNNVLSTMYTRATGNSGTTAATIFQVRDQANNYEVVRLCSQAQGAIQGNRMLVNGNQVMCFGSPHGTSGTMARGGNTTTYNSVYEHSSSSYRTTDNGMFGGTFVVSGNASYWYPVWFSLPTNCPPQELWINKYVHNYATWDGSLFFRASLSGTGYGAYTVQHRVHFYSSSSKSFIGKIIYTGHNNAYLVCWMRGGGRSYGWGTVGGNGITVNVGDDGNSHNLGPGNTAETYITNNLSIPQGYEQAMTTSGMHQQSDGF